MSKGKGENPHIGSDFDDFLREEGIYDEVKASTAKRVLARRIERERKAKRLTKAKMAARMQINCEEMDRLLDPENPSIDLKMLMRAADALGKRVDIQLSDTGQSSRVGRPWAPTRARLSTPGKISKQLAHA